MDQTAITYPQTTVNELSGEEIKAILEDIADNVFNPDPYLQQGGDMVRVAGLSYALDAGGPDGSPDLGPESERRAARGQQSVTKSRGGRRCGEGITGEPIWDVAEPAPARGEDRAAAGREPPPLHRR